MFYSTAEPTSNLFSWERHIIWKAKGRVWCQTWRYKHFKYMCNHVKYIQCSHRARKISEFNLACWASNPHVLLARGTSPLARVFKLINNSWSQERKSNYRQSPLGANHFHVYAILLSYFHNFQLLHSAFYKGLRFVIINMDEHCYNHWSSVYPTLSDTPSRLSAIPINTMSLSFFGWLLSYAFTLMAP